MILIPRTHENTLCAYSPGSVAIAAAAGQHVLPLLQHDALHFLAACCPKASFSSSVTRFTRPALVAACGAAIVTSVTVRGLSCFAAAVYPSSSCHRPDHPL